MIVTLAPVVPLKRGSALASTGGSTSTQGFFIPSNFSPFIILVSPPFSSCYLLIFPCWIKFRCKCLYLPDCEDELDEEGWGTFTSNHRDHLCGLYCLISSDKEGYLYDVLSDRVQLLATYPYTAPVSQVSYSHNVIFTFNGH